MKSALIVCFCLAAFLSNAQFKTPASKFKFTNDFINRQNLAQPVSVAPAQAQATVIATNEFWKVYALPKDKMPCLVPDISQIVKIPNATKYFNNSLMLNPYKMEDIIPQQ